MLLIAVAVGFALVVQEEDFLGTRIRKGQSMVTTTWLFFFMGVTLIVCFVKTTNTKTL
jgi:hypothetical protein